MAAPTPVSAYLHAAAMVKAGIYLVARFAPGFADTPGWMPVLVTLGIWTMLVGAWRSLRQYDLKLVLAYGTVSQLGFMMIVVGFGTRDAALAGLALLARPRALQGGALPDRRHHRPPGRHPRLAAPLRHRPPRTRAGDHHPDRRGVDGRHPAALRLRRERSGVHRASSKPARAATAGAGSPSSAPPSARRSPSPTAPGSSGAPSPPVPGRQDTALHASRWDIQLAPGLLAAATLVLGPLSGWLDQFLAPYADTMPGGGDYHLALWHGLEPALGSAPSYCWPGRAVLVQQSACRGCRMRCRPTSTPVTATACSMRAIDRPPPASPTSCSAAACRSTSRRSSWSSCSARLRLAGQPHLARRGRALGLPGPGDHRA